MDQQCVDLLDILYKMKKGGSDKTRTKFDATISKITWWFRGVSVFIAMSMALFALLVRHPKSLDPIWIEIIGWTGIAAMVLAILGLVLDMLPQIIALIRFRKVALKQFKMEIQYDLWHVAELIDVPSQTLKQVQRYLDLKIERSKSRIAMFMGGSDKLALFSLAGLGYSLSKEFPMNSSMWGHDWFRYGLGFLAGIAIGGILLNAVVQRYIYHRELIQLALEFQARNEQPQRLYNMPEFPFKISLRRSLERVSLASRTQVQSL